jgi:hypothetical protein
MELISVCAARELASMVWVRLIQQAPLDVQQDPRSLFENVCKS